LGAFRLDVAQAFLQCGDFAQPLLAAGFGQPIAGAGLNDLQAWSLLRIKPQKGAADAGVLVHARCAVGAEALAEFDPAQMEVSLHQASRHASEAVLSTSARREPQRST
jgi:hypothetical protein